MRIGKRHTMPNQTIEVRRLDFVVGIKSLDITNSKIVGQDDDDIGRLGAMIVGQAMSQIGAKHKPNKNQDKRPNEHVIGSQV